MVVPEPRLARCVWARVLPLVLLAALMAPSTADAGFFRTKYENGVWWLIDSQGRRFFSTGVNMVHLGGPPPEELEPDNPHYFGLLHHPDFGAWWAATAGRMRRWGFNTLGGWADDRAIARKEMPYVVNLHLGTWVGAPWEDVSAPDALATIRQLVQPIAKYKDDPLLIGYFIDNELGWYDEDLFRHWAAFPETDRVKQKLFEMLQAEYKGNLRAFLDDFKVDPVPARFSALRRTFKATVRSPGRRPDVIDRFVEWVADEYYRVLAGEVRRVDPNHLLLGDRYASFYLQPVVRAAGRWMDVVSVNVNTYAGDGWISPAFFDGLSRLAKKPIIMSEFYAAATENRSGNRNSHGPFLVVPTQKERAVAAAAMARQAARLPYVVGYHWFQWADEPPKGLSNGEDFNMGLVDLEDRPYEELTEALAEANREVVELHAAGSAALGLETTDGAWAVPRVPAGLTVDGQLGDWASHASWVSGGQARPPWLPFADFYLAWRPEGLFIATAYQENWWGGGEGVALTDRQRLIVSFADRRQKPMSVALVGLGEKRGPVPLEKEPDTRPTSGILPAVPEGEGALGSFDGVAGAQWNRSLLWTAEVVIPARMFGKEQLAEGDVILLGLSLVMKGETKETFWPSSQTTSGLDRSRLAPLRLSGRPKALERRTY